MKNIEESIKGYYTPGFFYIYLDTISNISDLNELIKLDKEIFSTFLHEYIHFLQNHTTLSGVYSSELFIEHIAYQIAMINKQNQVIELPLKITSDFNRDSILKLDNIYSGDKRTQVNKCKYLRYEYTEILIEPKNGTKIKPLQYHVIYNDYQTKKELKYAFGYLALKEYVAHKIQNKYIETFHPVIPYSIVDLILEKEIPKMSNNEDFKILLCDASLMHFHPAHFFFISIDKIKNNIDILNKTAKEFYEFLFNDLQFAVDQKKHVGYEGFLSLFETKKNDIIRSYKNIFGSSIFEEELNLLIHIIESGYQLRKEKPTYILDLVEDCEKLNSSFYELTRKMGSPTIVNSNYEGSILLPTKYKIKDDIKLQGTLFLAAFEISKIIQSGEKMCSLYQFCEKNFSNGINPTNYYCLENPLKKVTEDPACTLAQLCKTWSLHLKEFN